MMDYKLFIPSTLVDICPRIFQGGCGVAGICVSQKPYTIVRKTLEKLLVSHLLGRRQLYEFKHW